MVKNPTFVVGSPRSGTTLLIDVLSTHPEISAFPREANGLWHPRSYPWELSDLSKPPFWADPVKFTEMSLKDWRAFDKRRIRNIFGIYQLLDSRPVFLNKSAMVTFMTDHILQVFPKARFIHIYRDGRAVSFSWVQRQHERIVVNPDPFEKTGFNLSYDEVLDKISRTWKEHIFQIERTKQALISKGIFFEFSYEEFCDSPRETTERICDYLKIDPKGCRYNLDTVKNMNYKFRQSLAPETIDRITGIMKPALELKGYPTR